MAGNILSVPSIPAAATAAPPPQPEEQPLEHPELQPEEESPFPIWEISFLSPSSSPASESS